MGGGRFQRGGQPTISFFAFQDVITSVIGILVVITLLLALHLDQVPLTSTDEETVTPETVAALDARLAELTAERALIERLQTARAVSDPAALAADIARLRQQLSAAAAQSTASAARADAVRANPVGTAVEVEAGAAQQRFRAGEKKIAALAQRTAESAAAMAALEQQVKAREAALLAQQQQRNHLWLIPQKSATSKEALLAIVDGQGISVQRFGQGEKARVRRKGEFTAALKDYPKLDYYLVFFFKPSGAERFEELGEAAREAGFEIGYDTIGEDAQLHFGPRPATPAP